MKSPQPRIIVLDTETAPNLGYTWGKWEQNVLDFKKGRFFFSFAYKVVGEKKIYIHALPDYPNYKRDKTDDRALVKELWNVLNDADVIVAHNIRFDMRRAAAQFIKYNLPTLGKKHTICTLQQLRVIADLNSNKLDDACAVFGIGRKIPHTGKDLWLGCYYGDEKSWRVMKKYNMHDVWLCEKLYLRIRPYMKNHVNLNLIHGSPRNCPRCHAAPSEIIKWGKFPNSKQFTYTRTLYKQRYYCKNCGASFNGESETLPSKIVYH